ncbi:hypothetical protein [Acinetobacter baumannii]|uniref:hypothetical protein n=1 Tax=Acinetobacter baumannii TaxID=470 RepID=UPI0002B9EB43|nr:hypothetical protein [Acinetobacter baumannii]MDC4334574.1 hypothetical protein [Acinetobacter baumannii]MDC4771936.1 hypothetical protein [Acinetobacter baumannii]MDC4869184.1 hypothetical protein [Acinetobacter baumannii]HCE0841724.1 hypothetical protein [Acinetobacter baumannii]
MVDRAGQLFAGRFSWYGILTPVRSTTIIVRSNGGRFAKDLPRVLIMKKAINIIEHTPIYDLEAFFKRQKQIKRSNFLKKLYEGCAFICMVVFTFSFLFLGK